jgi:hypothetical protein
VLGNAWYVDEYGSRAGCAAAGGGTEVLCAVAESVTRCWAAHAVSSIDMATSGNLDMRDPRRATNRGV